MPDITHLKPFYEGFCGYRLAVRVAIHMQGRFPELLPVLKLGWPARKLAIRVHNTSYGLISALTREYVGSDGNGLILR